MVQEKEQTCMQKCMNPVAFFWGGPMMAVSDDNPWSYFERFAGGTTTAHGINRVFDDDSGIIRRIFWLACFAGGCFGLFKLQCIYATMIVIMHVIERALCRLTREEHITRC